MEHEIAFQGDNTGPGAVRGWLERTLRAALPANPDPAALIDDALIVTTELVTNAVNAGCRRGLVSCKLETSHLRLIVFDDAPGWPVMRHPGPTDSHGRGLRIIDALAAERGTLEVRGGKQAWATLTLPH